MRILYLSDCVPNPLSHGERVRAFHQVKGLSSRHEVHLVALAAQPVELLQTAELRGICAEVTLFRLDALSSVLGALGELFSGKPLTHGYFRSKAAASRISELFRTSSFDAVVARGALMARYAALMEGVPTLLDIGGVDSTTWSERARLEQFPRRAIHALESRRVRAWEESSLDGRFAMVVASSSTQEDLLGRLVPGLPVTVIGDGVDLERFRRLDLSKSLNPSLIFTGRMDRVENVDAVVAFARKVVPRLRRTFAELEFLIVGQSPTLPVQGLEEIPGVVVMGAVGDVGTFLARSWVYVAPQRTAQGATASVLEAMASRLPVVCSEPVTRQLREEGFRAGQDLIPAIEEAELESAICRLIDDAELRSRLGDSAYHRVEQHHTWQHSARRFEHLVAKAALHEAGNAGSRRAD